MSGAGRRWNLGRRLACSLFAWLLVQPNAAWSQGNCPPLVADDAQDKPVLDRGVLWRLQRDGRTSYLYGTLHVGRPAWQKPGARVAAALAASDTLALEIDIADPRVQQQLRQAQQPVAAQAPTPALHKRLAQVAARSCVPLDSLAGMPLLMQAGLLTLVDARWLGLDAAYGQERALAAWARAQGRRIVSLETAAEQIAALQPDLAQDTQEQFAQALEHIEDGSARQVLFRLAEGWERGDLALLAAYESWCECAPTEADRRFLRKLNDDRNPRLAMRIEAQHARGRRVFAAVGALHMTGPAALPALLAARGFRVQRVHFGPARGPVPRSIPK